jgi:hypothetical protein
MNFSGGSAAKMIIIRYDSYKGNQTRMVILAKLEVVRELGIKARYYTCGDSIATIHHNCPSSLSPFLFRFEDLVCNHISPWLLFNFKSQSEKKNFIHKGIYRGSISICILLISSNSCPCLFC